MVYKQRLDQLEWPEMSKKRNALLLFIEIGLLLLITPMVFWGIYWSIGIKVANNSERYFNRQTSFLTAGVIFIISIAVVIIMLKLRFLRSSYIKVILAWVILMLAALAIICICGPYMLGFG